MALRDRISRGTTVKDLSPAGIRRLQTLEHRLAGPHRLSSGRYRPLGLLALDRVFAGVPVRALLRRGTTSLAPVVVAVHGGGFVFGSPARMDWLTRQVAWRTGALVVAVDYRLAPDHPHPAGLDDVWAVLRALSAPALGQGGGRPIAVLGDSAGGLLATMAALAHRDAVRQGDLDTPLAAQVLIYPATDLTAASPQRRAAGVDWPRLGEPDLHRFAQLYLGVVHPGQAPVVDPALASPLSVADLSGLPPTLIQTASHDPLRADALAYANRLRDASVPTSVIDYPGTAHGFLATPRVAARSARRALDDIVTFLQRHFGHRPS